MNLKKIMQSILFIMIIGAFIYVGTIDFTKEEKKDNERFSLEYKNISKDNVFVYTNSQDINTLLRNGSAIIFMGFPSNKWSSYYAEMLNNTAKELGIKEILYYDFKSDRDNKNATYQNIVLKLSNYLYVSDTGKKDIYAPTLVIIKNGRIIHFDGTTNIMLGNVTPAEYWNEVNRDLQINKFREMLSAYLE